MRWRFLPRRTVPAPVSPQPTPLPSAAAPAPAPIPMPPPAAHWPTHDIDAKAAAVLLVVHAARAVDRAARTPTHRQVLATAQRDLARATQEAVRRGVLSEADALRVVNAPGIDEAVGILWPAYRAAASNPPQRTD